MAPLSVTGGFLKGLGWDALAEIFGFIILGVTGGHWEGGRNTQAVAAPKSFQGLGAFLKTLKLPSDHPLHVYLPHALGHLGSSKRGHFLAIFFRQKSHMFLSLHAHVAQQHPGSHSCHKKNGCFQK